MDGFLVEVASTDLASIEYLAAALGGVIALFAISNVLHRWSLNDGSRKSTRLKPVLLVTRSIKSVTMKRCVLLTSNGHLLLFAAYVGINLALMLTNISLNSLISIGKRLGWLATGNMCFVFVLSIKNTPLSFLTSVSYEKLNLLHQVVGYMTATLAILHGVVITAAFAQFDMLFVIGQRHQHFGIAAALMMLTIALSSRFLIRRCYEVFYLMHVVLVIAILITLYFHRRGVKTRTPILVFICAGLFALDKLIRTVKYLWFSRGTVATITALPNRATRVTLNRSVSWARPGSHAFLWLPHLQRLQTHPCTMISVKPVSFIFAARTGFTEHLHRQASDIKNMATPAAFDAAYGAMPPFEKYSRVILVAGGSGATWTIAVGMDLIARNPQTTLEFVWVFRDSDSCSWFASELALLHQSPNVNVRLFCTGSQRLSADSDPSSSLPRDSASMEKEAEKAAVLPGTLPPSDQESNSPPLQQMALGRPSMALIVSDVMRGMGTCDRMCVGACGPTQLLDEARTAVAAANGYTARPGPLVDLHVETYGW